MKKLIMALLICVNIFAAPGVGDKEVDFNLPDLYNQSVSFSNNDFKGKVVLLNLWASWCDGCKEEMPLFVELQKEFDKNDFLIVLSSIDSDPQNAISFLKEVDDKRVLTSLYDGDKTLPKGYRSIGMPSSYLIDKDGKLIEIFVGSIDKKSMKNLKFKIKDLLGK
jgi:thiol-disulfide isomerase/thioredoxin